MDDLHPDYPRVEGMTQLTTEWSVFLPVAFARRIEEGELVFWRPGLTFWIAVWSNDHSETRDERAEEILRDMSPDAYDIAKRPSGDVLLLKYRLREDSDDQRLPALYAFAFGASGHVQLAAYFDSTEDQSIVEAVVQSLAESSAA